VVEKRKILVSFIVGIIVLIILGVFYSHITINENALFAAATIDSALASLMFVGISILLALGDAPFIKYLVKINFESRTQNPKEGEFYKLFVGMIRNVSLLAFSAVILFGVLVFKNKIFYISSLSFFSFSFTNFIFYLLHFAKVIKATLHYTRKKLLDEEDKKRARSLFNKQAS